MIFEIILCIAVLIFAFVGMKKGFMNTLINLIGFGVTVVVAIFTSKYVADFLEGIFDFTKTFTNLLGPEISSLAGETSRFNTEQLTSALTEANVDALVTDSNLSNSFTSIMKSILVNGGDAVIGNTASGYITQVLAGIFTIILSFVITFILVRLVIKILSKVINIFEKKKEERALNSMDKMLGFVLGLVYGLIFAALVFLAIFIMYNIPNTVQYADMVLKDSYFIADFYAMFESTVEKWLTNTDIIVFINGLVK